MEVILLERVNKLGKVGDVVSVKNGYARNWLIPQNKALRATQDNKAFFEQKKAEIESENNEKSEKAAALAGKVSDISIVLLRQAGEDGRLFGSVNARDIAIGIAEKGFEVTRNNVVLVEPIKSIGIHKVTLSLHADVQVTVTVNVARTVDEAKDQSSAGAKTAKAS